MQKSIKDCNRCDLGNKDRYSYPRGNPDSKRMIIGEGPGEQEVKYRKFFCGPAGKLLDAIFNYVGWNTDTDWYLTNVVRCQNKAKEGSGRQNNTPTNEHRQACSIYINQEIEIIKPKIIVLLGQSAVSGILNINTKVSDLVGKLQHSDKYPNILFYIMYHPAYLLHSQKYPEKYQKLRLEVAEHINNLRSIVGVIDGSTK